MKRNQIFEWRPNLFWMAGLACTIMAIGCTRTPGEGGQAVIHGKIEVEQRLVITNPSGAVRAPAADEDVFIIYGDRVGPDDRVQTNFDGEFSFYGMRTGDYTVYVYSEDTMPAFNNAPKVAIIRDLTITSRDEEYDLGTLRIFEDI
jgi:hypothetical protein